MLIATINCVIMEMLIKKGVRKKANHMEIPQLGFIC
jgi:hypothetical protein